MDGAAETPNRDGDGSERLWEVVRAAVQPVHASVGDVVVRQGDEGRTMYLVESGAVDVVVTSDDGPPLPVARLGPGTHFGEMSLLTGTPVSADVVASEPTVLYAVDAEGFERLIRPDQSIMEYLAGELAARLRRTNARLAARDQSLTALGKLIGTQVEYPFRDDLPSFGKGLRDGIDGASRTRDALLIVGEEGVGKRALARHIHSLSDRAERIVLVADCQDLPAEDATEHLFGDAEPTAVSRFAERLGYLQAADGGTLILAHVDRLPTEAQEALAAFIEAHREPRPATVDVRIIATSTENPEALAQDGLGLLAAGQVVELLPLRHQRRRRDIVPLAQHFLEQTARQSGREPKRLADSGQRELLTYDFPNANVEELAQVIELADRLAEGSLVGAEHVFFGGGGPEAAQLDLLRHPWLERFAANRSVLNAAKVGVAAAFAAIIAVCLIWPNSGGARLLNAATWGTWWPGLLVSLILLGRVWCAVCPLSGGGETVQRLAGRHMEPPGRLPDVGPSVALIGFVGIIWVEQMTAMSENPRHTALLLMSLALAAATIAVLYQRHTWCRYLCPLGAMGAVFSAASALRIRARREVCQGSCTGHECYKGSGTASGCPMFNHILFLESGQYCKLCLECLRSCPSQAARLILQFPLRDIWRSDLIRVEIVPLAVVVFLTALLLAATGSFSTNTPEGRGWFTAACVALIGVGLSLGAVLRGRREATSVRDLSWTARAVYAYTPAAAAVLFAFHLQALPWIDGVAVQWGTVSGRMFGVSLLQLGQWVVAMLGSIMTLWALAGVCGARFEEARVKAVFVWAALGFLAVFSVVEALLLMS